MILACAGDVKVDTAIDITVDLMYFDCTDDEEGSVLCAYGDIEKDGDVFYPLCVLPIGTDDYEYFEMYSYVYLIQYITEEDVDPVADWYFELDFVEDNYITLYLNPEYHGVKITYHPEYIGSFDCKVE